MTKVDIFTTTEGLEIICSMLSNIGHNSLVIQDSADFEDFLEGKYGAWDYLDCELMKLRDIETTITLYLPDTEEGRERLREIHKNLEKLKTSDVHKALGRLEVSTENLPDENWETSWRKYYNPIKIGKKLLVCPPWEIPDIKDRETILIDPGMAFGTGIDETTRLCLEALENTVMPGHSVLDIGCGSGILAIGALKLGAASALGVDTAVDAVKSAKQNAELNKIFDRVDFVFGNAVDIITEKHDIVCANISADVIIDLASDFSRYMMTGSVLILSGIIEEREQDVISTMLDLGFTLCDRKEENGWVCLVMTH